MQNDVLESSFPEHQLVIKPIAVVQENEKSPAKIASVIDNIFFLYFIVLIYKLHKGQAKRYYNITSTSLHKKGYTQRKRKKIKWAIKRPITL